MELCGFARAGVPGEYSPFIVSKSLATDKSASASYTEILTLDVVIESPGEVLVVVFSATGQKSTGAGGGEFQIKVDGIAAIQTTASGPTAGSRQGYYITYPVSGLAPGKHTVSAEFKISGVSILAATSPTSDHATLICFRNRPTSDREIDGFVQRGWQMIHSLGTHGLILTSAKSSTSATITDPLISGLEINSRYAQSALLIRFSASGDQNDAGDERTAKFQLYVDGQAVYGTADSTGTAGFANVAFNAALVAVVPVQAGIHTIDVKWSGSTDGLRIDPATGYSHCAITVEEVFCEDLTTLSDMEGYAAANYASKNLPRVSFKALKTDVVAIDQELTILEKMFYVTGENSALQIEATTAMALQSGESANIRIYVNGDLKAGSQTEETATFVSSQGVSTLVPVAPGNHFVELRYEGNAQTFEAGTHSDYMHANMLIREVVSQ